MSGDSENQGEFITFKTTRFSAEPQDFTVPADSVIEFPSGIIGFPRSRRYVMLEHSQPFSWLHSIDDSNLAFVVVDGFEFGQHFDVRPPIGDKDTDFKESDEYAILLIVTIRSDPRLSTVNLKAPLFVNMRNRKGVQVIFDDPRYSTRHPLWSEEAAKQVDAKEPPEGEKKS